MAKEEKPLEYQRRIRDTKGIAQRLDLGYLKRPRAMAVLRNRLTWLLVAAAAVGSVPLVLGIAGGRRAVSNGPLSAAHTMFEKRCEVCHAVAFGGVADRACEQCHDGPAHPAKALDTARPNSTPPCAQCHREHLGKMPLAEVADGNCTSCHADLPAHASGVRLQGVRISAFRAETHPEFSAGAAHDARPLRLNHAAHMPTAPRTIGAIKLPMKCGDCHATDRTSPNGALLPVTFDANCRSCHARELEFDVDHVLAANAAPAPHLKDAKAIHEFILAAYRNALAANPALAHRPVGNDLTAPAVWIERVVRDAEGYLFGRKCAYCHEVPAAAVVRKVNRVTGRYVESKPEGEPWFPRGEFAHRSHRAVACESCHVNSRASRKTDDVLIPELRSCLPCHGQSSAGLDRCSLCHQYHNRALEKDGDRRPTEKLVGQEHALPAGGAL